MTTNKPEEAMTDREVLELAAKAAGLTLYEHVPGLIVTGSPETKDVDYERWNPLDIDGDALRLAMALGIDIVWCSSGRVITIASVGDVAIEVVESSRENREENTRRAITRAAAEIGRSME